MGVADNLPDPSVGLGETDHSQRVVLVTLRNVNSHIFVEPVTTADNVRHTAKGLEDHVAILSDEKFVELLRSIGGRTVVVILGQGPCAPERKNCEEGEENLIHPGLSSELCGKAPASP